MIRRLLTGALLLLLGACASTGNDKAIEGMPELDLFAYFEGNTQAEGMIVDRSGEAIRFFSVDIEGEITGNTLTLNEQFHFNDGETDERIWTITQRPDGSYRGEAADVVGEAKGEIVGNRLSWQYVLQVEASGRQWDLKLDDRMYLIDEYTLLNRAVMSKFGFRVGEIIITFSKEDTP